VGALRAPEIEIKSVRDLGIGTTQGPLQLRAEAATVLTEVLHRGEIARGDVQAITGLKERTARVLLGQQLQARLLGSDSEKGPVSLRLPVNALDVLFPRLFLAS
jgi:hypothetical protein